ncbi:MAG: hypothetical protein D6731_17830 [Planctomycetota bacterium]|nr:MAG: hypothetical protein D6731_17830 [Planctomycetota bacterium]
MTLRAGRILLLATCVLAANAASALAQTSPPRKVDSPRGHGHGPGAPAEASSLGTENPWGKGARSGCPPGEGPLARAAGFAPGAGCPPGEGPGAVEAFAAQASAQPGLEPSAPEGAPRAARDGFGFDLRDGLTFTLADPSLRAHAGALLAVDHRTYDRRNQRSAGAYLDRALLRFDARLWEVIELRLQVDLRGIDTRTALDESYVSVEAVPGLLRLSGGLLRIGVGTEHSFAEETLSFVDYASPAVLTGRHDLGLALDGEAWEGLLSWYVAAGGGEGFDAWGHRRGDPVLAGRAVVYPFRWSTAAAELGPYRLPLLSGFFVSVGGLATFGYEGHLDLGTSLRNRAFTVGRIEGDRSLFYHGGYGVDFGPLRFLHEFVRGSIFGVDLPLGGEADFENKISSWSASLAWRVTGEPYDSRPFRQRGRGSFPRRPLCDASPQSAGFGTLEVAVRYTNTEGDREFFDRGFTRYSISSQEFRAFDVALNWYPVRTLRLTFQLTRVIADQEPAAFGGRGRDTSFLFRLQVDL